MDGALCLVNEIDERTNGMEESRRNTTSDHCNDGTLYIAVFSARHLFNVQNTILEVPHHNVFVMTLGSHVEFLANHFLAPLEDMIEKDLWQ